MGLEPTTLHTIHNALAARQLSWRYPNLTPHSIPDEQAKYLTKYEGEGSGNNVHYIPHLTAYHSHTLHNALLKQGCCGDTNMECQLLTTYHFMGVIADTT